MRRLAVSVVRLLSGLLLTGVVGALCQSVAAAEPGGPWHWFGAPYSHCPCPTCPEDYCCKPMPCMSPVKCCGPNDYCCKPLPCMSPVKCCGPNDYCCKPLPVMLPLCRTPCYTCGPPPTCDHACCSGEKNAAR